MEWTMGKYDIGQVTAQPSLSSCPCILRSWDDLWESLECSNYIQIILYKKHFIYMCVYVDALIIYMLITSFNTQHALGVRECRLHFTEDGVRVGRELRSPRGHNTLPTMWYCHLKDRVTVQYKAMGALLRHLNSHASLSLTPAVSS